MPTEIEKRMIGLFYRFEEVERPAYEKRIAELEKEASMYREEIAGRCNVIRLQDEEMEYLRDTTIPKVSLRDSDAVMGEIKVLRSLHEKDTARIVELEEALVPFAKLAEAFDSSDVFSTWEMCIVRRDNAMRARAVMGDLHDHRINPPRCVPLSPGDAPPEEAEHDTN